MALNRTLIYVGGVYRINFGGTYFHNTIGGLTIEAIGNTHHILTDQAHAGAVASKTGRHRIKQLGYRIFIRFTLPEFEEDSLRLALSLGTAATQWAGGRWYFPIDHEHIQPDTCIIEPAIPAPAGRIYKFAFHHVQPVVDCDMLFAKDAQLGIPVVLEALWDSTLNRFALVYYDD